MIELGAVTKRFAGKRELVVDFAEDYEDVRVDCAIVTERDGPRVVYQFERGVISASELISALSARYRIRDLSVREPDIEDTIRRIYEERLLER